MSWLEKLMPSRIRTEGTSKRKVPEGLWDKCESCGAVLYRSDLERNLQVCPKCNHHMRINARTRLQAFLDETPQEEIGQNIEPNDFLKFKDSKKYKDRLTAAQKSTGEKEALIVIKGEVKKLPVVAAAFDFNFIGGSMGSVVGERFLQGAECALDVFTLADRISVLVYGEIIATGSVDAIRNDKRVNLYKMLREQ